MRLNTWRQDNLHEGLRARVAEHLGGLVLAARDGLDAAAVDLAEVGSVIQDEADAAREVLPIRAHGGAEQVERTEHPHHQLQHKRRAAHDRYIELHQKRQRLELAHAAKRHQHAEGQRAHKRDHEDDGGELQAEEQQPHHGSEFHWSPSKRNALVLTRRMPTFAGWREKAAGRPGKLPLPAMHMNAVGFAPHRTWGKGSHLRP